jgi:hypothetical protein
VALERGVRACSRNGQFARAWTLFTDYRHRVGVVTRHLYTRMIQIAGRLRRPAQAVLLFEELLEVVT